MVWVQFLMISQLLRIPKKTNPDSDRNMPSDLLILSWVAFFYLERERGILHTKNWRVENLHPWYFISRFILTMLSHLSQTKVPLLCMTSFRLSCPISPQLICLAHHLIAYAIRKRLVVLMIWLVSPTPAFFKVVKYLRTCGKRSPTLLSFLDHCKVFHIWCSC